MTTYPEGFWMEVTAGGRFRVTMRHFDGRTTWQCFDDKSEVSVAELMARLGTSIVANEPSPAMAAIGAQLLAPELQMYEAIEEHGIGSEIPPRIVIDIAQSLTLRHFLLAILLEHKEKERRGEIS